MTSVPEEIKPRDKSARCAPQAVCTAGAARALRRKRGACASRKRRACATSQARRVRHVASAARAPRSDEGETLLSGRTDRVARIAQKLGRT